MRTCFEPQFKKSVKILSDDIARGYQRGIQYLNPALYLHRKSHENSVLCVHRNTLNRVPALCSILLGNYKVGNLLHCPLALPFRSNTELLTYRCSYSLHLVYQTRFCGSVDWNCLYKLFSFFFKSQSLDRKFKHKSYKETQRKLYAVTLNSIC